MTIFNLLSHASLLIHCGNDIKTIVEKLITHQEKFPSPAEFDLLLDDCLGLLSSGVMALPAEVTKQFIDALSALKGQL